MDVTLVSPFDPTPPKSGNGDGHVGGVERVLSCFSTELADRGHDVTVLCSSDSEAATTQEPGYTLVRVPRVGTLFRAPIARLAEQIPEDADLVHVPATYPFITSSTLREAHKRGIPSVLDFHFEPHPGNLVGRLAARVYRSIGTGAWDLADAVLVRSYAYGRSAPSLDPIPEDRWHRLPNGVDPQRFHPDGPTIGDGDLLFVGRLVRYKGLSILFEALDRADLDVPLRIVGDGPLRGELETLARTLDLDVRFHGHVPEDELPAHYRGADLTVLPSVNQQEAFGVCLVESMACGTPVVASDLPGVGDVAREGGRVAVPGDPASLAQTLTSAVEDATLPRGALLAERIHERYAWDAVADRLVDIYEAALQDE